MSNQEVMDMTLSRSVAFHLQANGYTKIINCTIVYLLTRCNAKNLGTLDKSILYLQFAYNKAMHFSTGESSFEAHLGFTSHSPLDLENILKNGATKGLKIY